MSTRLEEIMESTRPALERWLADALDRRRELEEELRGLDGEVARARAWLGGEAEKPPAPGRMALHEAMELLLREGDNRGMKAADLSRAIAGRDLYRMRDGRRADVHQIQARVTNYQDRFVREGGLIKLRNAG
jgi:hypothetical protein